MDNGKQRRFLVPRPVAGVPSLEPDPRSVLAGQCSGSATLIPCCASLGWRPVVGLMTVRGTSLFALDSFLRTTHRTFPSKNTRCRFAGVVRRADHTWILKGPDQRASTHHHDTAHENGQREQLSRKFGRLVPDPFTEDRDPEQTCNKRIHDRQCRLRRCKRARVKGIRDEIHREDARTYDHVRAPCREDSHEPPTQVGTELLDHRSDKPPHDGSSGGKTGSLS